MLIILLGYFIWLVYDFSRMVEIILKVFLESVMRVGERKGEIGGLGEEDNGGY